MKTSRSNTSEEKMKILKKLSNLYSSIVLNITIVLIKTRAQLKNTPAEIKEVNHLKKAENDRKEMEKLLPKREPGTIMRCKVNSLYYQKRVNNMSDKFWEVWDAGVEAWHLCENPYTEAE